MVLDGGRRQRWLVGDRLVGAESCAEYDEEVAGPSFVEGKDRPRWARRGLASSSFSSSRTTEVVEVGACPGLDSSTARPWSMTRATRPRSASLPFIERHGEGVEVSMAGGEVVVGFPFLSMSLLEEGLAPVHVAGVTCTSGDDGGPAICSRRVMMVL